MKSFIKTCVQAILPFPYHYRLRQIYRQHFGKVIYHPEERDIVIYEIQPQVLIKVYWKVLPIGKGPALAFIVSGDEILRFDCFGKDKGHYHIFCGYEYPDRDRIYFPENTVEEQINRTAFELKRNLKRYLQLHRSPDIRDLDINTLVIKNVCEQACQQMLEYLWMVPEFEDLRQPLAKVS